MCWHLVDVIFFYFAYSYLNGDPIMGYLSVTLYPVRPDRGLGPWGAPGHGWLDDKASTSSVFWEVVGFKIGLKVQMHDYAAISRTHWY